MDKIVSIVNQKSQGIFHAYWTSLNTMKVVNVDGITISFNLSERHLSWSYSTWVYGTTKDSMFIDWDLFDEFLAQHEMIYRFVSAAFLIISKKI